MISGKRNREVFPFRSILERTLSEIIDCSLQSAVTLHSCNTSHNCTQRRFDYYSPLEKEEKPQQKKQLLTFYTRIGMCSDSAHFWH